MSSRQAASSISPGPAGAGKSTINADEVARTRWALGREYVYGETSTAQMLNRLAGTREMGFDYDFYETWRSSLANVTPEVFPKLMEPCHVPARDCCAL